MHHLTWESFSSELRLNFALTERRAGFGSPVDTRLRSLGKSQSFFQVIPCRTEACATGHQPWGPTATTMLQVVPRVIKY